jgi:hypothetical protein
MSPSGQPVRCAGFCPEILLPAGMVGLAGFEPTTSSSRTKRATKLRYSPNYFASINSNGRLQ